eukprot:gene20975-9565_t
MSRRYRCVALIALIATLAEGVDPPEQQPYILQTTTLSEVPVFSSVTGDNFDGVGDLDESWSQDSSTFFKGWKGNLPGAFKPGNAKLSGDGDLLMETLYDGDFTGEVETTCNVNCPHFLNLGFYEISARVASVTDVALRTGFWLQNRESEINILDTASSTTTATSTNMNSVLCWP